MSKSGICSECKRPIQTCVAYPYILCVGGNSLCMQCAYERLGEFVIREDKELLEELGKK